MFQLLLPQLHPELHPLHLLLPLSLNLVLLVKLSLTPSLAQLTSDAKTVAYTITSCSDNKCTPIATSGVESETVYTTDGQVVTDTVTVPCDATATSPVASSSDVPAGSDETTTIAKTIVYSVTSCDDNKCTTVSTSGVESETVYTTDGQVITNTLTVPCDATSTTSPAAPITAPTSDVPSSPATAPTTASEEKVSTTSIVYSVTSCSDGGCSTSEVVVPTIVTVPESPASSGSPSAPSAPSAANNDSTDEEPSKPSKNSAVEATSVQTSGAGVDSNSTAPTVALLEGGASYLKPLTGSFIAVLAGILFI
ncbi:unnamed protein product [Ambrosiozyma monospora]|uniref:Unnamed protein product n=1 Tax=Ambrosiozyma monospora TaxID=43982 RepID=A0ACB5T3V3_AMBMO|nr:unnamed protein product [Ambrosiozyma monospora]